MATTFTYLGLADCVEPHTVALKLIDISSVRVLSTTISKDGKTAVTDVDFYAAPQTTPIKGRITVTKNSSANGGRGSVTVTIRVTGFLQRDTDGVVDYTDPWGSTLSFTLPAGAEVSAAAIDAAAASLGVLIWGSTGGTPAVTTQLAQLLRGYSQMSYMG